MTIHSPGDFKQHNPYWFRVAVLMLIIVMSSLQNFARAADQSAESQNQQAQQNIRGLIKPKNQAVLSSEISAKVIQLPYRAGEAFNRNDILAIFDCSLYQAQLDAAEADKNVTAKKFQNAEQLLSYKATSPIELEIAKAEMQQAQARYEIEQLSVEGCTIRAPYPGRVVNVLVNEHETINRGAELLSILNNESLEVELIVPSSWLGWLSAGDRFDFFVDETQQSYTARVARIGASVDPVSQTVGVVAQFDKSHADILAGMSGNATFKTVN